MTTKNRETESLEVAFEKQEAGVAALMEFYEKVEDIYVRASASISESEVVYASDSTNTDETKCLPGAKS